MSVRGQATVKGETRCIACARLNANLVGPKLDYRKLSDGTAVWLCVDPTDCRLHWPQDDDPLWRVQQIGI